MKGINNPTHTVFIVPMGYQNDYLMIPGLKFAGSDLFRMTPKKLTVCGVYSKVWKNQEFEVDSKATRIA